MNPLQLNKQLLICCCAFISNHAFSGTIDEQFNQSIHPYLIGLSAGPSRGSGDKTQTLYLQPDIQKSYVAEKNNQAFTTAELFLAKQFKQNKLLEQFGFVFAGAGNAILSGDIWELANPNFNNFEYQYKLNHAYIALKGRVLPINFSTLISPYLSASLGVAFNRAYQFKNTPKITEEVPLPNFKNKTKTSVSYTVGAGIEKTLTSQFKAAIGYEIADWGSTQLAPATGQTLNQGLSLKHFYAQQLQFSLFYAI
ncbi:MAG: porin family protein [Gammaproteobacteria bacterium]|nr:porin family protein [Gammaproteobacteria bacterium]MCH9717442.1 porin family protein [Gammaproteobacteria bacterium]MCH9763372.1 porin family protein [Gammaproteobacteria bacterium]